jgi:ABC-type amino acid transport substrate-binding protein
MRTLRGAVLGAVSLAAGALMASAALADTLADIKKAGEFVAGTEMQFPPFVTLPRPTGPDGKFANHLEEGYDKEDAATVHSGIQGSGGCPAG